MAITSDTSLIILSFLSLLLIFFITYLSQKKIKRQLDKIFIITYSLFLSWIIGCILQIICVKLFNFNPIYFDYFSYISVCFLPVAFFFMARIFAKTKITFKKWYCLLFIIPTVSLILLWTNNLHHLFYENYSTEFSEVVYGKYFAMHQYYTLLLYMISFVILLKYAIKNSGIFSKQAILILIGALTPLITNLLGLTNIMPMSVYVTPMSLAITIICIGFAVSRFSLLKVTPIALQKIVDRISDSYIVLNENYQISNFNQTFINTFHIKNQDELRGKDFKTFLKENSLDINQFKIDIDSIINKQKTEAFELYIEKIKRHFNVEVTSIVDDNQFLGILILLKDVSQHVHDMQTIKKNQDVLMENERLASLGQLIGGIAHNLKTPIMSVAGAAEGLKDLVTEYDLSIDDPEVNSQDHHEIAHDMNVWIDKIKGYAEYMSDIITTVKGQAVTLGIDDDYEFTIRELVNRVDILMKHELKNAIVYLHVAMKADENIQIHGDINSLVQVINNMISNSIQAYAGKPEQNIDMSFYVEGKNLIISVKDYAGGLPQVVKKKLFKEMITTKGKNGTGLGLYMSYSNIRARFNGDITFESDNQGTTFYISLPI